MEQTTTYDVELCRVHKGSPYNCSGYIPSIKAKKGDDVINLPEVQKMIKQTYGKHFILTVYPSDQTYFSEYKITKNKAIIH